MFISEENEQLSQQLDPQEVGSLARSSSRTQGAAGNCWREHLQKFEMMTPEEHLRTVSERAGCIRTVSKGRYYRIGEGVDDGFGNLSASCREYILSRTHPDSEAKRWNITHTTFMELRFRSPQHLKITPKFGWTYPESSRGTQKIRKSY